MNFSLLDDPLDEPLMAIIVPRQKRATLWVLDIPGTHYCKSKISVRQENGSSII